MQHGRVGEEGQGAGDSAEKKESAKRDWQVQTRAVQKREKSERKRVGKGGEGEAERLRAWRELAKAQHGTGQCGASIEVGTFGGGVAEGEEAANDERGKGDGARKKILTGVAGAIGPQSARRIER